MSDPKNSLPQPSGGDDVYVAVKAAISAIRTHQKLKALRNAVLNIAIGRTPDEDEQAVFPWYIGSLSTWHLRISADPQSWNRYAYTGGNVIVRPAHMARRRHTLSNRNSACARA